MDRAPGFEPGGQGFESLRAHHFSNQGSHTSRYARQVVCFLLSKAKPKSSHRIKHRDPAPNAFAHRESPWAESVQS